MDMPISLQIFVRPTYSHLSLLHVALPRNTSLRILTTTVELDEEMLLMAGASGRGGDSRTEGRSGVGVQQEDGEVPLPTELPEELFSFEDNVNTLPSARQSLLHGEGGASASSRIIPLRRSALA